MQLADELSVLVAQRQSAPQGNALPLRRGGKDAVGVGLVDAEGAQRLDGLGGDLLHGQQVDVMSSRRLEHARRVTPAEVQVDGHDGQDVVGRSGVTGASAGHVRAHLDAERDDSHRQGSDGPDLRPGDEEEHEGQQGDDDHVGGGRRREDDEVAGASHVPAEEAGEDADEEQGGQQDHQQHDLSPPPGPHVTGPSPLGQNTRLTA